MCFFTHDITVKRMWRFKMIYSNTSRNISEMRTAEENWERTNVEMAASADRSLCLKKGGGGIVIYFTIFAHLLIRFISRLSFDLSQRV